MLEEKLDLLSFKRLLKDHLNMELPQVFTFLNAMKFTWNGILSHFKNDFVFNRKYALARMIVVHKKREKSWRPYT